MQKLNLVSALPEEISVSFAKLGIEKYRLRQIADWLFKKKIFAFAEMKNIPRKLQKTLDDYFRISLPKVVDVQTALDGTKKYLLAMDQNSLIEAVVLSHAEHRTLCLSTQVGCKYKCVFCATGFGFERNLTAAEIVLQFLVISKEQPVDNIVFMGMGEPLDNFAEVVRAITILSDSANVGFSQRRITVSTCGLVPQIKKLADLKMQITLAISLNAAHDAVRNVIMPINKKYNLVELKSALLYYQKKTGRKITLEYVLLKGVNNQKTEAEKLAKFCQNLKCNVNLIPWNKHKLAEFVPPTKSDIKQFRGILEKRQIPVVQRYQLGADIDAACGQLRLRK